LLKSKISALQESISHITDQIQTAQQQWQSTVAQLGPKHGLSIDEKKRVEAYLEQQQERLTIIRVHHDAIQAAEKKHQSSHLKVADLEKQDQAEHAQLKLLRTELENHEQQSKKCADQVEQQGQQLLKLYERIAESMEKHRFDSNTVIRAELAPLSLALISFQEHADMLTERQQKWTDLDKLIGVLNSQIQSCKQEVTRSTEELTQNKNEQQKTQTLLTEAQQQRRTWFEGATIGFVRLKDKQATESAEKSLQEEQQHQGTIKAELENRLGQITVAQQNIEQLLKQKNELNTSFEHQLSQSPFECLETFLAALMPEDEQLNLQRLKQNIDQELKGSEALLKQNQREFAQHRTERPASLQGEFEGEEQGLGLQQHLELLSEKSERLGELDQQNQRRLGELKLQLDKDQEAQIQQKDLLSQLEQQRQTHDDWSHLNGLIGSADGSKFRKFAQGLTLDHLVHLANRQLKRLHGRYLLKRKADGSLELMVVDTWQADTERDTKTLSGGESFLTSLALALALSDLVSQKTNIDSLFLDEGFGTLDPDMLNMALDALDALNASGKMIGVISHVEALKERIPVQIQINKSAGLGVSRMDPAYAVH
jgi:exonuclease SbcC